MTNSIYSLLTLSFSKTKILMFENNLIDTIFVYIMGNELLGKKLQI